MTNLEEWSVYKHTSPNGKIYIGITHQKPEKRWLCGHGYKRNTHFWKAIQKFGWNNFTHEILATGLTQQQAEKMEKDLVREYNSTDKNRGYNVAEGGHALTEASREKIGATRKERRIKPWNTGKHLSQQTRDKISEANKGNSNHVVWTDEQKERVRATKVGENNPNYGKPMTEETKQRLRALNEIPVVQICEDGDRVFKSAKEAGEKTGIANCNITRVCKGQRATAGGYAWRYA